MFDVYSEWISPTVKIFFANPAYIQYGHGVTIEAGGFDTLEEAEEVASKLQLLWRDKNENKNI